MRPANDTGPPQTMVDRRRAIYAALADSLVIDVQRSAPYLTGQDGAIEPATREAAEFVIKQLRFKARKSR
jgi:hypothetical protein